MKKFYLVILLAVISSCQTSKKLTAQNDLKALRDSLNIDKLLEKHNLAGFSLAVFEDFKVVYSEQWGMKSSLTKEKIDPNTAFSTASISKPVTALLCFILEEKGMIDLDDPIKNYLECWRLPQSSLTEDVQPTWKHFLNHTAGTNQHGFADYYEGDDIPTLQQSLLGQIPRYEEEINFTFKPGTSWAYSGGGYVIVQMALEDHLGKPIAQLAKEFIFDPLNMNNTTMYQPNEEEFLSNIALVHDEQNKVIRNGLPITPQVSASGMWSTPLDLAKLTLEIQNALQNKSTKVISTPVAMKTTEVTALKDAVGGWSYGWQRSFGFHNNDWFTHNGSNTGVGGDIFATMTNGNGFIMLANGEKPNRFPVIDQTRIKILSFMSWENELPKDQTVHAPLELKQSLIGTYNDFLYGQGFETSILLKNDQLYVDSPFFENFIGRKDSRLLYLGNGKFKIADYPNIVEFKFKSGELFSALVTKNQLVLEVPLNQK